ncbi:MAG: histidine--tRNA ligase [Opitutae bacterium]
MNDSRNSLRAIMFNSLPGFREFYPEECARRNYLFDAFRRVALRFGFKEYDAPVLEPLELYIEKSGEEIVSQLFNFTDRGDREVALRPELTPSLARLVGAKASSLPMPVKWFNIGEHYRYERPQKGRLRAFYQFNGDILGESGTAADAELISLLVDIVRALGHTEQDFRIRLSDRTLWFLFLEGLGFEEPKSLEILSILDKSEKISAEKTNALYQETLGAKAKETALKIEKLKTIQDLEELREFLDSEELNTTSKEKLDARLEDWTTLIGYLGGLGAKSFVQVDLGIVRGLAYYTGFVFEAFENEGQFRALAGGGRYNDLVAKLGGPELPAAGFAIGDVTLTDCLDRRNLLPQGTENPEIITILGGETERLEAIKDITILRRAGFSVAYPLKNQGFGKQFKSAGKSGAKIALIYGGDELSEGKVKIRNLSTGEENLVDRSDLEIKVRGLF